MVEVTSLKVSKRSSHPCLSTLKTSTLAYCVPSFPLRGERKDTVIALKQLAHKDTKSYLDINNHNISVIREGSSVSGVHPSFLA